MQRRTSPLTAKENEVRKSLSAGCAPAETKAPAGNPGLVSPVSALVFILIPLCSCTQARGCRSRALPVQPHREKTKPHSKNIQEGGKENACNNNNNKNNREGLLTGKMPVQLGCKKTQPTKASQPFTQALPSNSLLPTNSPSILRASKDLLKTTCKKIIYNLL